MAGFEKLRLTLANTHKYEQLKGHVRMPIGIFLLLPGCCFQIPNFRENALSKCEQTKARWCTGPERSERNHEGRWLLNRDVAEHSAPDVGDLQ